jgi:hypothetical protein
MTLSHEKRLVCEERKHKGEAWFDTPRIVDRISHPMMRGSATAASRFKVFG